MFLLFSSGNLYQLRGGIIDKDFFVLFGICDIRWSFDQHEVGYSDIVIGSDVLRAIPASVWTPR
ncbi:hypothetical protein A0U40_00795 [[Bacillus] sp. KCTC 13219]|nr:hypothetical protein A0U40_00795 [[Bacillus] sp. KCTC 13219]